MYSSRRSDPAMAVWKALLLLMLTVTPSSSSMVTDLPGGGHVEVESGSRGQVCMYIIDDWGTAESTKCTSTPGTYTLTGRGGGQARVTISEFGGVSVKTGYFGNMQPGQYQPSGGYGDTFGAEQQQQPSEEEETSVRFGSYKNPRPVPTRTRYPGVAPVQSPPDHVARRLSYRRPPLHRRRPTATPTLVLPPVTEAGLGAVEIVASGPGQLTVFGTNDNFDDGGVEMTGPSVPYPTPEPLVARKKRNRLSAVQSNDGSSVLTSQQDGDSLYSVQSADGSSVLASNRGGQNVRSVQSADGSSVLASNRGGQNFRSVQSADGSSVVTSHRGGQKVSSVQSADGSSVVTSQTAGGQRLGLVRSADGSVVFSTYIDGRLVNVVRSSDGSSVVSINIDGHQVTALTSPTGQRLIAGAGPGQNLEAFFNQLMLQIGGV